MAKETKTAKITFSARGLMQVSEDVENKASSSTDEQRQMVRRVEKAIKAYLSEAEELLGGKLRHLNTTAPLGHGLSRRHEGNSSILIPLATSVASVLFR